MKVKSIEKIVDEFFVPKFLKNHIIGVTISYEVYELNFGGMVTRRSTGGTTTEVNCLGYQDTRLDLFYINLNFSMEFYRLMKLSLISRIRK